MTHYSFLTLTAIGLTMFVSIVLIRFVEAPIDSIRQNRLHQKR